MLPFKNTSFHRQAVIKLYKKANFTTYRNSNKLISYFLSITYPSKIVLLNIFYTLTIKTITLSAYLLLFNSCLLLSFSVNNN